MIKVTTVKKVLKELAKEHPDAKAECYYSVEEQEWSARRSEWAAATGGIYQDYEKVEPRPEAKTPMCIVGHVVARLNGIEKLPEIPFGVVVEDYFVEMDNEYDDRGAFRDLGYSPASIKVLATVQRIQDGGESWGDAVKEALRVS